MQMTTASFLLLLYTHFAPPSPTICFRSAPHLPGGRLLHRPSKHTQRANCVHGTLLPHYHHPPGIPHTLMPFFWVTAPARFLPVLLLPLLLLLVVLLLMLLLLLVVKPLLPPLTHVRRE